MKISLNLLKDRLKKSYMVYNVTYAFLNLYTQLVQPT